MPASSSALSWALDPMLQHSGMHYFCHTSNSMKVYKPPESSKIIQSSPCLHLDNTSPRLVSTFTSTAAPGFTFPSRLLPFLYCLAHVHQEDRSSSLAKSGPLLKNVLTNAPSVSSQHLGDRHHLHRNISIARVTSVLRTCYASARLNSSYKPAHC